MFELEYWRRFFKIRKDGRVFDDLLPVVLVCVCGHDLHRPLPFSDSMTSGVRMIRQRLARGRYHQFQVAFGQYGVRVLPIEHLALFGQPYLTREGSGRLCKDRPVTWASASDDGATTAMEEPQLYSAFSRCSMKGSVRLENLPGAGKHSAVFV